jgi:hypothetical protein
MKDIFKILQEEKNRILGMHESATKNQYLGEQSFAPYNTGNYQLDSAVANLPNQPVPKKSSKVSSYTTTKWNQFSYAGTLTTNVSIGFKPGAKFEATQNPKIVTAKNVNVLNKDMNNGSWVPTEGQKRVSFYCEQGKFFFEGDKNPYVSAQLSAVLVKYVCGYKSNGEKQPTQPPVKQPDKTTQPGSKGTPSQSNSQLIELNKQIQQLLGNQAPTGKITDTDIDAILSKLV